MDLSELLGTDYKEGMTVEEINTALSSKKLADLSTGKYLNKEMVEANEQKLNTQIKELKQQLNDKLPEEEKKQKEAEEKDKKIEELTQLLQKNALSVNKSKILVSTSETRGKLGIKDDDKDFNEFVDSITLEDDKKSSEVSSYLGTLLANAYKKGAEDEKKSQIANNNSFSSGANNDKKSDENDNVGSRLAKEKKAQYEQGTKKSNFWK